MLIRNLIFVISFLVVVPSLVFAYSASYCGSVQERVGNELSSIKSSNADLMAEGKIENIDKIITNANTASRLADELKDACDKANSFGNYYDWCYGYFKAYASDSADIKLKVADYCLKKKLPDKAKQLYREIITTYTGDAYRAYVKQAEFGLEDVRTLEKKMEQDEENREKAEREAKERAQQSTKKNAGNRRKK